MVSLSSSGRREARKTDYTSVAAGFVRNALNFSFFLGKTIEFSRSAQPPSITTPYYPVVTVFRVQMAGARIEVFFSALTGAV